MEEMIRMRIVIAFKQLIKTYHRIIPTYLLAALIVLFVGQIIPVIGAILVLPVSIGVAHAMLFAADEKRKGKLLPLFIGFKKNRYLRNLKYLLLRQAIQYIPLIIGLIVDQMFPSRISTFRINLLFMTIGWNFFLFAIPSAIFSLIFSMVPYLLADPLYNINKGNPLFTSIRMLKGNYIRLISIRLVFLPFLVWAFSGFLLSFYSLYSSIFGQAVSSDHWITSWLFSAPVLFLFFIPWYQMTHAVLYGQIRKKY